MILGIDYGLKNIGLAVSEGLIAEPYETLQTKGINSGLKKIEKRVEKLGITKIIIGISEGKSKDRAISFGRKLEKLLQLPIEYTDETLSTHEAENIAGRKKDGDAHARAAAVILQRYLDENHV